MKTAIMLEAH